VVLLPRVAATDTARRWRLLRQALLATTAAATLAVIGYVVFSPLVVGIVYPDAFAGAAETLPPLALAMGAVGVYSVLSQWWMGRGDPRRPAVTLVIGAIAAGVAHLLLDARFGGLGAAVAMLIGATVAIAILGILTLRLPDRPRRGRDQPMRR
jgi:O-antigen/teichoic acid export membrane protein